MGERGYTRGEALALAVGGLCDVGEWLLYALVGRDLFTGTPTSLRIHGWAMDRADARAELEREEASR